MITTETQYLQAKGKRQALIDRYPLSYDERLELELIENDILLYESGQAIEEPGPHSKRLERDLHEEFLIEDYYKFDDGDDD